MTDFVYNCGIGTFVESSVYADIKSNNDIKNSLLQYTFYKKRPHKKLLLRRMMEYNLYTKE